MRYMWGLDCFRALAVLLVFGVHYLSLFMPQTGQSPTGALIWQIGHSGVELFFVLSGFLLYAGFMRKPDQSRKHYLMQRAKRIFPAYWVALSAYAMLFALGFSDKSPTDGAQWLNEGLRNIFLLSPLFYEEPWLSVSWTLTFEWGWYLALPLLFSAGWHRLSSKIRQWGLILACLGFGIYFGSEGGPERLSLFFAGALLAEWKEKILITPASLRAVAGILFLAWGNINYHDTLWLAILASGAGWALCLSLALSDTDTPQRRWLPFVFLGKISYSFYLWHSLALHGTRSVLGEQGPWELSLIFSFIVSVVLAYASYMLIEKQVLQIRKARSARGALA